MSGLKEDTFVARYCNSALQLIMDASTPRATVVMDKSDYGKKSNGDSFLTNLDNVTTFSQFPEIMLYQETTCICLCVHIPPFSA